MAEIVAKSPLNMDPAMSAYAGTGAGTGTGTGSGAGAEDVDRADSMVVVGGASMPRAPERLLKCLAAGLFLNMAMRIPKGAYVPPKVSRCIILLLRFFN